MPNPFRNVWQVGPIISNWTGGPWTFKVGIFRWNTYLATRRRWLIACPGYPHDQDEE